jgi:exodeoxyribonuclease VII small subunit
MEKKTKKNNLTQDLKSLEAITEWFENQEEVDVEEGLKKVKEGAKLIKQSRNRLKEVKNEFQEIKDDLETED